MYIEVRAGGRIGMELNVRFIDEALRDQRPEGPLGGESRELAALRSK